MLRQITPKGRKETGGATELKHSIRSGLESHGRLNELQGFTYARTVFFPNVHFFLILLGAQKAMYASSPERRHLRLYAQDMID